MKVGFITSEFPPDNPGGAGISSKLIADSLRDQGINVDMFATVGDEKSLVKQNGIYRLPDQSHYPGPKTIGENISVFRHLPSLEEYDLLHVYNVRHLPGVVLRSSTPTVSTMNNHTWISPDPEQHLREGLPQYGLSTTYRHSRTRGYTGIQAPIRSVIEYIGKTLSKRVNHYTVQTEGMKTVMTRSGYDPEKIDVIPNILDDRFRSAGINGKRDILFIGQLYGNKGPIQVIQAFDSLPEEIKNNWRLKIYGKGELKPKIKDLISKEGLAQVSLNYSPYDKLPEVYNDAGLLIHASKYTEPFSRTWLEAMASGTPIVASENPSSSHILKDVAEFYDPFDTQALAETLQEVLSDEKMRESMAKSGKREVEKYTPERVGKEYADLYNRIVS
ncbi:glycosyltransferase family 4 protein [Haloarcula argentinensis]|uniref:Glycosyltransferase family 4 protein n=1 Tax=Haloarcula argentinensis TaxID=43776 RepID=A0ABU2EZ00_HALAR|nr:glycosyltransferase family 4 protein [Haloarcula argentinensis]MDS0253520.1 glycosyltransferase family 4 protein [Haloarcula argentinensis]